MTSYSLRAERSGVLSGWERTAYLVTFPHTGRKFGLMYLLSQLRRLSRSQVQDFASASYEEAQKETYSSLADVCVKSGLIDRKSRLRKDTFLKHMGIAYTRQEMEREFDTSVQQIGDLVRTIDDTFAGAGPIRPVLKDLYGLWLLEWADVWEMGRPDELFWPTSRALSLADATRDNYLGMEALNKNMWRSTPLLVMREWEWLKPP